MTILDLQQELMSRGVLGAHLSLVGGRFSLVAVTAAGDADAKGPTLESAARLLLQRLPVAVTECGHS